MKEKDSELYELMKSIGTELSCSLELVVFTHYALVKDIEGVNNSEDAIDHFVTLVNDLYSNIKKGFLAMGLAEARQLNEIAKKLEEKEIVKLPKKFSFSGLSDFFEKNN